MKRNVINVMVGLFVTMAFGMAGCGGGGGDTSAPTTPTGTNSAPVANAGAAQSVVTGAVVTLDGSASSDANGDLLTYSWAFTSKPAGSSAALSTATVAKPTFTADVAGAYVLNLVVNDGKVNSATVTVTITASVANAAPVANAGIAQSVVTGAVVTLDGSASSDANGDLLTYSWAFTSKPAGSSAVLSSATAAKSTFTADVAGAYVLNLVVNDGKVSSTAVTVTISATVSNAPQLKAFSIAPTTINTTIQSQIVTVNLRLTDGLSGINTSNVHLSFQNPSGSNVIQCMPTLVSGTNFDGNYSCNLTIPQYAPQGTWNFYYFGTTDNATNSLSLYKNDMIALGFPVTFQSTGTGDSSPPQLKAFSITTTSINTSAQAQSVTLNMRLTDDMSGVQSNVYLSFKNPSGSNVIQCMPALVSGTNLDGNYSCNLSVPQYAPQGTWHFYYLGTTDNASNLSNFYETDLISLGYLTSFQNTGQ